MQRPTEELDPNPDGETVALLPPLEMAQGVEPPHPPEGYAARSARGGIILTATKLATSLIGFASQIALGWFLLPEDFGAVAVAISISSIIAVLRDAGAPLILIQRQNEFERIAGSVFWMTLCGATFCALLTAGAAPIVAHLKHNPVLLPVILWTALRFPIGAFGTVSSAKLSIDLRWGMLAAVNVIQPLVTGMLGVLMAYRHWGVYSLVIPGIVADALRGWASWMAAGGRVRLRPDMTLISGIVVSSVWIVLSNLTLAGRGFGDYLTLSFTRGEHETGIYYYAFVMAQSLSGLALTGVFIVLTPVFSRVKHDEERHAALFTRAMHFVAMVGVLPIIMQTVLAWPLFRLFLKPQWAASAPLFSMLSVMILATFLNNVTFQAMWARGLYRAFFRYSILFTAYMLLLFVIGALTAGARGVATAQIIAGASDFVVVVAVALPLIKVPWRAVVIPLWKPLAAALPAVILALLLSHALPVSRSGDVLRLLLISSLGTLGYVGILLILWRHMTLALWGHFRRALGLKNRASFTSSDPSATG